MLRFVFTCAAAWPSAAATFQEDFAEPPTSRGWAIHGDDSLFQWEASNQNLLVTWDSSRPNSYFWQPLGTMLAKSDDFALAFELQLESVAAGVTPEKPFTFELAIGFVNRADAASADFLRGVGSKSPNLVEFDYFPDTGFGATIWPSVVSTNGLFSDSGSGTWSFTLAELTTGDIFAVVMSYTAADQTLRTTMTRNGESFGPLKDVVLGTNFTDFRVDTVAICSYSDAEAGGSILARGIVDDLSFTVPDPPVARLEAVRGEDHWGVKFQSRTNWVYTLEATVDFRVWEPVSPSTAGTGAEMLLYGSKAGASRRFYRVRANRP